ncbi:MAG TPA: chemotaxis protein CheW [Anaeromyxobacter sp.]
MPARERAQELPPADDAVVQLCTFRIGGEDYAVDIMRVREIIHPRPITPVPRAPAFVEGVIRLRREVIPVLDVRKRLGVPAGQDRRKMRFLVANVAGRRIALVVDEVCEVLRLPRREIRPAPALGDEGGPRFFLGVCGGEGAAAAGRRGGSGRLRLLLNVKALLDPAIPGEAGAARAQAMEARRSDPGADAGGDPGTP